MFLDPKGKNTQESHKREQGAIPGLKPDWESQWDSEKGEMHRKESKKLRSTFNQSACLTYYSVPC